VGSAVGAGGREKVGTGATSRSSGAACTCSSARTVRHTAATASNATPPLINHRRAVRLIALLRAIGASTRLQQIVEACGDIRLRSGASRTGGCTSFLCLRGLALRGALVVRMLIRLRVLINAVAIPVPVGIGISALGRHH